MANGRTPTRKQRQVIKRNRLNSNNWLILKNPPGEMHLIHRVSGSKRVIRYPMVGRS